MNQDVNKNVNDTVEEGVNSSSEEVNEKAQQEGAEPSNTINEDVRTMLPKKKKRRKDRFFLKLGLLIVGVIGLFAFLTSSFFDIDQIKVVDNERFDKKEIVEMSKVKKGENIFALRKKLVANRIEENPYISKVKINKDFPRGVEIKVIERKPFVTIRVKEKHYILLNREGYVLEDRKKRPKIPLIKGLKIKSMEIGEKIKVKDKELFERSMEMLDVMKEQGLFFKKIDLTNEEEYKVYIYDTLIIKGSAEGVNKHLENGNISTIVYDLYKKKIKRGTIQIKGDEFCSFTPIF